MPKKQSTPPTPPPTPPPALPPLSPEDREILAKRARELARVDHHAQEQRSGEPMMTFQVGAERYGIPARTLRGIQPLNRYTRLPALPAAVVGLVNVRGRLLALIDVRPLLGMPAGQPGAAAMLLVVDARGVELALLADEVHGVHTGSGDLTPPLSAAGGQQPEWVRGLDEELTLILDPLGLAADSRLRPGQERA